MSSIPRSTGTDLRRAARLATVATGGLTDLVEAVHARNAQLPGGPVPAVAGRTSGITGIVHKSIRGVTPAVGGSVDALLERIGPALSSGRHVDLARTLDFAPERQSTGHDMKHLELFSRPEVTARLWLGAEAALAERPGGGKE